VLSKTFCHHGWKSKSLALTDSFNGAPDGLAPNRARNPICLTEALLSDQGKARGDIRKARPQGAGDAGAKGLKQTRMQMGFRSAIRDGKMEAMPESKPKTYRLVPEMVPSDLWGRSAYQMLKGRVAWTKRIRPDTLALCKQRCKVCAAEAERMLCHEKWVYDDKEAFALLSGFEMHCPSCDLVTHIGRMAKVYGPETVLASAVEHLCKVNKCDEEEAGEITADALKTWEMRNRKTWKIRVAPELLQRYPELERLPKFKPQLSF